MDILKRGETNRRVENKEIRDQMRECSKEPQENLQEFIICKIIGNLNNKKVDDLSGAAARTGNLIKKKVKNINKRNKQRIAVKEIEAIVEKRYTCRGCQAARHINKNEALMIYQK